MSFVNPTEGATVSDASSGAALDFTDNVSVDTQHCKLDDAPYADCSEVRSSRPAMRNGDHRYRVKTIDIDGDVHIDVLNFVVNDISPPVFTVAAIGGSPISNRPRFEIDLADAFATVMVSVGDVGPERFTISGPEFEWSPEWIPNGQHSITFRVIDPALNVSTEIVVVDVDDQTAPGVTINTPTAGGSFAIGNVQAEFSTDDPDARHMCSIDDSAPQLCWPDDGVALEGLSDGVHEFSVKAIDSSGNEATVTHSFTVTPGSVSGLSIVTPAQGVTYAAEPLLDIDVASSIDEDTLRCSLNGGVYKYCSESSPIEGITHNGTWTLDVRARDSNGDRVQAQSVFTVADSTGPTVSTPSSPLTIPDVDGLLLLGNVDDEYADGSPNTNVITRCSVDDASPTNCADAILGPLVGLPATLTPGVHTLIVHGTDWIGNTATSQLSIEITDTTGSMVEILSPDDAATVAGGGLTIDYRVNTVDFFAEATLCQIDAEPAVKCVNSELDGLGSWTPVGLDPGAHTITVSRTDLAGNVGSASISITVTDATGPAVSILAPSANATLSDRVGLVFATDEKVVSVKCSVDDPGALAADPDQCDTFSDDRRSGFFRPTSIAAGVRELWIEVADVHGNTTQASLEITVNDTTAPDVRFDHTHYGEAYAGSDSPQEISFSSTDLSAAFTCSLDGGASYSCGVGRSSSVIPPLVNGPHTFAVTATDPSGNVNSRTLDFEVADLTPPPLIVSGVSNGMAAAATLTVDVSSELNADLECAVNAGAFSACGLGHVINFASSGSYTLRFRATDVAGNATDRTFAVTATVPVPPVIPPSNPDPPATPELAVASAVVAKPKVKMTKRAATISYQATVSFPASVDRASACILRATVKVHVKKKQVGGGSAPLKLVKGRCVIAGKLKVKTKSIAGKKFALGVTYAGNALIKPFYTAKQGKSGSAKK